MPRIYADLLAKRQDVINDALHYPSIVASRKVGTSYTLTKQRITCQQHFVFRLIQRYMTRRMTRRMNDTQVSAAELNLTTIFVTHDQEEAMVMSDRIFLMNKGAIIQSGAPAEIYEHPVDAFAAGFIGSYNILPADFAQKYFHFDGKHKCAVRPESIYIGKPQEAVPGLVGPLPATIKFVQLLGSVLRCTTEVAGTEITVDSLNLQTSTLKDGQQVELYFTPSELQALNS